MPRALPVELRPKVVAPVVIRPPPLTVTDAVPKSPMIMVFDSHAEFEPSIITVAIAPARSLPAKPVPEITLPPLSIRSEPVPRRPTDM
jgi:hypothetical protein